MAESVVGDATVRERVQGHFDRLRTGFMRALETARRSGELPDDLAILQVAEYLAVSVQGLAVYSRLKPDESVRYDDQSCCLQLAVMYLDLHDYRRRVFALYRERNEALQNGEHPESVLQWFRDARDRLFAEHAQSALDEEQKRHFGNLSYFPYNPGACVEATVDPHVDPQRVLVHTSGEGTMPMSRAASLRFTIDGREAALSMYWIDVYGGGLFLPFRDTTAPTETYGGGRYLFDTIKGSDFLTLWREDGMQRIWLDFNYAYNPSCAYNYRWVCPLAPPENRLPFPIRAGEKVFSL